MLTPVIVPFGTSAFWSGGIQHVHAVDARLYYDGDPVKDILNSLPKGSIHILLDPPDDCDPELFRILSTRNLTGSRSWLGTIMEKEFCMGCCPECYTPWDDYIDLLKGAEIGGQRCSCSQQPAISCTVLDFQPGDGSTAVEVLKAGINYIGIGEPLPMLGVVITSIETEIRRKNEAQEAKLTTPLERVAEAAHVAWSGWISYMFSKCLVNPDGSLNIPAELVERWTRQMNTPYAELSESEKDSDRREADRYLIAAR